MIDVDAAFVTTRLVDRDAQGNLSAATLSALKGKCDQVTLYSFSYERPPVEGVDVVYFSGENTHSLKANFKALLRSFRLAKSLAKHDLLLLAGPDFGALPAVHLARRYNRNLRLVWVYHSLTPPEFLPSARDRLLTRLRKFAYLASMKRSDHIQTFSSFVKKELVDANISQDKITSLPFGVDLSRFAAGKGHRIREKHDLGTQFVVLYVGRLAPAKRVDRLIEAVAGLDGATLIVVGGGPERERLEAMAADSSSKIIFAGKVPDEELPDYYAACNVWATASEHEGFCVPVAEAMAAGKPVIVPDVTAMPETAGEGGLIYPPGNTAALTDAIRQLMGDYDMYGRLAAAAARRAEQFRLEEAMKAYLKLFLGKP